jgi:predicted DNA-binding transcriptional regulator YafY
VNESAFIARGLRAHKNATRKICATERQIGIQRDPLIISAIRRKSVLKFSYNGKLRTVEPQTYGLSTTGREVLRAYERPATNGAKRSGMAKLFDLKKISGLRESGQTFQEALPAHNPDDSAMVEIFATLPAPKN